MYNGNNMLHSNRYQKLFPGSYQLNSYSDEDYYNSDEDYLGNRRSRGQIRKSRGARNRERLLNKNLISEAPILEHYPRFRNQRFNNYNLLQELPDPEYVQISEPPSVPGYSSSQQYQFPELPPSPQSPPSVPGYSSSQQHYPPQQSAQQRFPTQQYQSAQQHYPLQYQSAQQHYPRYTTHPYQQAQQHYLQYQSAQQHYPRYTTHPYQSAQQHYPPQYQGSMTYSGRRDARYTSNNRKSPNVLTKTVEVKSPFNVQKIGKAYYPQFKTRSSRQSNSNSYQGGNYIQYQQRVNSPNRYQANNTYQTAITSPNRYQANNFMGNGYQTAITSPNRSQNGIAMNQYSQYQHPYFQRQILNNRLNTQQTLHQQRIGSPNEYQGGFGFYQ